MKKALIVGIDDYGQNPLRGCCSDAKQVYELLRYNADETKNFDCRLLTSDQEDVTRPRLFKALERLYEGRPQSTLLYFAGHGGWTPRGGGILPQEATSNRDAISMRDIQSLIPEPHARETVIVLDCCYSGSLGESSQQEGGLNEFHEGMSLLAASRAKGQAEEVDGEGVFSSLFCSALKGGGANLLGEVSIGSVYAYVDQALGAWGQRPTFKAYLSNLTPLRQCEPRLDRKILRNLPSYFEDPRSQHELDPAYEPTAEPQDLKKQMIFRHLQRLRDVALLVPVGEEDLYYAAMNSKSCELTPLGRFYWRLAKDEHI